jgi:hypothetical protein
MVTLADVAAWLPLLAVGLGLFLAPGLALRGLLAAALPRGARLGAPDGALGALLDGLGLSLALWPLLLLYAHVVHLPFNALTAGVILGVSGAALVGLALARRRAGALRPRAWLSLLVHPLTLLTGGAIILRFIAVHYLLVPNWGDSVHHTLITQLFLEQDGVPSGYAPYAPVYSFTYHFGFHGLAALWAWLTGQTAWSAVISVGQILNACAVPAAYVLTRSLFGNRTAALASAVVVGYLSGMPTQYVNWGRYTQLAGQVLLPFALVWFMRLVEAPPAGWRANWPRLALAAIGAAGLGLTHYRILIFYALFVPVYLVAVMWGLRRGRDGRVAPRRALGRALAVAGLGGLLFAPWMGSLLADYLPGLFSRLGRVTTSYLDEYAAQAFLTQYIGLALPALAVLGGLLALLAGPRRARAMALVVAVWTGLLAISAKPEALGLPGAGAVGTMTVGIALYLPLGTLAGPALARPILWALVRARRAWAGRMARWAAPAPGALALLAALVLTALNPGARTTDTRFAYVTPEDAIALAWVRDHTPAGARFLISGNSTYQGRAITASDAGMWLPLLAGGGRTVSIPPLSSGSEGQQAQDFAASVQALYQASRAPTAPASLATLKRQGVGYVFIGAITPSIAAPALLRDPAHYCLLFRLRQSYVFRVQPDGGRCP